MSISVPILYLVGYYYEQGYLETFGVNSDYFPRTVQEYLVTAFFAFTDMIFKIFSIATKNYHQFIILGIFVFVVAIVTVYLVKKEEKIIKIKNRIRSYKIFDYVFIPSVMFLLTMLIPYLAMVILGSVVLIPIAGYYQGKDKAKKSIEKYLNYSEYGKEEMRRSTLVKKGDKIILKGKFVAKSENSLAIFDGVKTQIISTKEKTIVTAKEKKPNTYQAPGRQE